MGAGLALWDLQTGMLWGCGPERVLSQSQQLTPAWVWAGDRRWDSMELPVVPGDAMPRASHSGQGPTEGTAGHGDSGTAWCQLSDGTAREGLGTQWTSNILPVLTRAPRALQILVATNTGGQGWGADRPHRWQERRADGPRAWHLQDSQEFCVRTRQGSSGQTLVITVPPQPRTAATVSQQEGPGLTPKHCGWGV